MTTKPQPSDTAEPVDVALLLSELTELAADWDQEARDRHLDGMASSADSLRACRDELRRILRRHQR